MLKKNIFIFFLFVFTIFVFAGCASVNNNNSQTGNDISRPTQTTVSSTNVAGENVYIGLKQFIETINKR